MVASIQLTTHLSIPSKIMSEYCKGIEKIGCISTRRHFVFRRIEVAKGKYARTPVCLTMKATGLKRFIS